jgi:hypothetical protein
MSYTFVPCPPLAPAPESLPTWTSPADAYTDLPDAPTDAYTDLSPSDENQICEIFTTPTVYYSVEILVTSTCEDGPANTISFIVPPFQFSSTVSQEAADGLATAYANQTLAALRDAFPCSGTSNLLELSSGDLFSLSNGQNLLLLA